MKPFFKAIFVSFSILLLIKCTQDEATPRAYPRIITLPVTEVNSNGATFHAEIVFRGNFEVLAYGFVWDDNDDPRINYSEKVVFSTNITSESFSTVITGEFSKGVRYYVKSFIQTEEYTVYGQAFEFVGP